MNPINCKQIFRKVHVLVGREAAIDVHVMSVAMSERLILVHVVVTGCKSDVSSYMLCVCLTGCKSDVSSCVLLAAKVTSVAVSYWLQE